ncbi:AmmeMemoRadiSam system protein A [Anaerostipes sp.]|uniref:AmmeMemoRadiSam system protein A n=1 Tax=Anaerostipes sp. TaxID=1872530 RepID=UPI0025B8A5FF|nr:AmmeMemoRadiSam system protein A [Anaerostipes sp.]MBS7007734.1 AmmeMemoRadiSam system protein A [Anaerostipes sp.]
MAVIGAFMVPHPPLIIPSVGCGKEQTVEKTVQAYNETAERIAKLAPETIVIATPHSVMYSDYFHISPGTGAQGDFAQFGAGGTRITAAYDQELTETLTHLAEMDGFMAGTDGEQGPQLDHAFMIPLYFISQRYQNFQTVRMSLSGLSLTEHYTLGQYVKKAAQQLGRNVVFIASGDLSHRLLEDGPYGFRPEGPLYDEKVMEVMGSGDFQQLFEFPDEFLEKAGECGHRSFMILAGALDGMDIKAEKLSYEGPYGVGYGVCAYMPLGENPERKLKDKYLEKQRKKAEQRQAREDSFVRLARLSLESYVKSGTVIGVPDNLSEDLLGERSGVFVSLKKEGRLRGCIGTICATKATVAEEIIWNAVSAGARDPRFSPVKEEELDQLEYSVDVLGKTQKVSSFEELDSKKYGIIVSRGGRRGLLLPNLSGVDTVEEQIEIAKQKAGIGEEESVKIERFEVIRHR